MAKSLGKPRKMENARKVMRAIEEAKGKMRNERPNDRGESTAARKRHITDHGN